VCRIITFLSLNCLLLVSCPPLPRVWSEEHLNKKQEMLKFEISQNLEQKKKLSFFKSSYTTGIYTVCIPVYSPLFTVQFALIMESNQQPEEEEELCSICLDSLPKLASKFTRMTCCGKGLHIKCYANISKSSMSDKQKDQCIMCRTASPKSEEEQAERVRRWVEKGKAWAQSSLGCKYDHGIGVDQSDQRARELRELAANQGQATAQYNLGVMYQKGQGVDQSYERAREYYEAAVKQGHVNAQFNLGALYVQGQGVEQSNEKARALWMKAAEQGDEDAIKALQMLDEDEGRTTPSFTPLKRCSTCDTPKTSTHKLRNCKCNSAQYCDAECQKTHWKSHQKEHRRLCKEMNLKNTEGEMKDEVVGEEEVEGETKETVTADSPQQEEEEDVCPVCVEVLQKDSNKFTRYSCCGKGIHKWCDKGIDASSLSQEQKNSCPLCRTKYPTSKEETIERLRPWVEKGKAWAQCMLGQKYDNGVGVEQSYQTARELFELSASQGWATAQFSLGVLYQEGQGVDQSDERAAEYYEAAATQGYGMAQSNLGFLYVTGNGVEQSNEKARKWWMKAAEQGVDGAIENLQIIDKEEGRTTPSFIPKPIECASCYRPHDPSENKLRPCKRCHRVYYCGKECQTKHWKKKNNGHKEVCNNK